MDAIAVSSTPREKKGKENFFGTNQRFGRSECDFGTRFVPVWDSYTES